MKIGILREGKIPADRRVPLTPAQCAEVQESFPGAKIIVQPSQIRCYHDESYLQQRIHVQEDLSDCDVLFGVKEVVTRKLIPGKTYFFFSHTIKEQEYNKNLLQAILNKNIRLVDYEVLTGRDGIRIIGFGRYAGLVGAYSGIRAYGLRNRIFDLTPAYQCDGLKEMLHNLNHVHMPPVKIAVTGDGKAATGAAELLDYMKITKLSPEQYLLIDKPAFPVYTLLAPQYYVKRKDDYEFGRMHFYTQPEMYSNAFLPYAHSTDLLIAAAYWDPNSPVLFTEEDMNRNDFRIQIISDITCDIEGAIPSTKRAATIEEPFYDYNPQTGEMEPPFSSPDNITVQAVDNLPNELPKDASEDFGRSLIDEVLPALINDDRDGILERATITKDGQLHGRYIYLYDFVYT